MFDSVVAPRVIEIARKGTGFFARGPLQRDLSAGEADAAIDPLAEPGVREAVAQATFEHLVGFQLTQDQLKYNATR